MWLRDFLRKDLPRCRTMIYGYNSKLSSYGINTILDFGRELVEEIKKIRNKKEVTSHHSYEIKQEHSANRSYLASTSAHHFYCP